jgi:hypothetical protein
MTTPPDRPVRPAPRGAGWERAALRGALISFDIDGTLETGDPPGPLTLGFVRWVAAGGARIGSCSDRTLADQTAMWARHRIAPDFVCGKHQLGTVRARFSCDRLVHIGDTHIDEHFARLAGFEFLFAADLARRLGAAGSPAPDSVGRGASGSS